MKNFVLFAFSLTALSVSVQKKNKTAERFSKTMTSANLKMHGKKQEQKACVKQLTEMK